MKISTDIRKSDLVFFNFLVTPRLRSTYVGIGVLTTLIFGYLLWMKGVPFTTRGWVAIVAGSIGGGIGGIIAGTAISLLFVLASSTTTNGIIGQHDYEIRSDGFAERTAANEGISRWGGIQSVRKLGPFICIQISDYLFHLVPRRSFESDAQFQAFYQAALGAWKGAA